MTATRLTLANWNIEWMNRWFTADDAGAPRWRGPGEGTGIADLDDLSRRVAQVIAALGADILTIQEGPSRKSEMSLFVRDRLADAYGVFGPAGKGQQKLYALVRKDSPVVDDVQVIEAEDGFSFADPWDADIDADLHLDPYSFTRPPLVLAVTASTGRELRLVNIHTKSKYVHNGAAMWNDPARRQAFIEAAVAVRRRISAEAMRIRAYLDSRLLQDEDAGIVVAGDFNDGPGLDYFERHFLTHNVAGLVAGNPFKPRQMLRHTFVDLVKKEENYTVRFFDFVDGQERQVLLDHIFVSPALFWHHGERSAEGRIAHDVYEAAGCPNAASERETFPSDHRPQVASFRV